MELVELADSMIVRLGVQWSGARREALSSRESLWRAARTRSLPSEAQDFEARAVGACATPPSAASHGGRTANGGGSAARSGGEGPQPEGCGAAIGPEPSHSQ